MGQVTLHAKQHLKTSLIFIITIMTITFESSFTNTYKITNTINTLGNFNLTVLFVKFYKSPRHLYHIQYLHRNIDYHQHNLFRHLATLFHGYPESATETTGQAILKVCEPVRASMPSLHSHV